MFRKLLTFLLVLTSINGWVLDVNEKNVMPYLTTDVTIRCHDDAIDNNIQTMFSNPKTIKDLIFIRILKFIDNGWQIVASITKGNPVPNTSLMDTNTTGQIDNKSTNSFLQIYVPVADKQTIGKYVCDIEGFNENMETKSIKTEQVVIRQRSVTYNDMLELISKVHQQEKDHQSELVVLKDTIVDLTKSMSDINVHVKKIHDDLQKVTTEKNTMKAAIDNITKMNNDQSKKMDDLKMHMSTSIKNITTHLERVKNDQSKKMDDLDKNMSTSIKDQSKKMDDLKLYITNISTHQEIVNNDLKVYINNFSTQQETIHKNMYKNIITLTLSWPTGKYSIPEPDTGCPKTLNSTWAPSSYRISTAPNNNNDTHSSNLNLAGSVFKKINNNNYFTMKLCSMTGDGNGQDWPVGSYCVQVYSRYRGDDQDCPSGLHYGWRRYGRFNDNSKDVFTNLPGNGRRSNKKITFIHYCCRNDGSPTNPISLPSLQPFYLYRYGGICQEVVGMEVSNEWIHTDTGKWKWKERTYKNAPDGSVKNGVTTRLCYYKPRD